MWRWTMESQSVVVKFGGDAEVVGIEAFSNVLLGYASVVRAAHSAEGGASNLDVSVESARAGCLEVTLSLSSDVLAGLLGLVTANAPMLPQVISNSFEFYRLMAFLGKHGEPESTTVDHSSGKTSITTGDNASITINNSVYHMYSSAPGPSKAFSSSFRELEECPEVEYMSLSSDSAPGDVFRAERADFPDYASTQPFAGEGTREIEYAEQALYLERVVLRRSKRSMWRFVWNGISISANITDQGFFDNFDSHSFSIGDAMLADLKVVQRLSPETQTYLNERYEVTRVVGFDKRPENPSLF